MSDHYQSTSAIDLGPDHQRRPRARGGRVAYVPAVALAWSTATFAWSMAWMAGALPHPFGERDLVLLGGVFHALDPIVGIVATAIVGLVGTATALVIRPAVSTGVASRGLRNAVVSAWALAGFAGLVLVHGRLLSFLGYTPVLLVRGWFDVELRTAFFSQMDVDLAFVVHALIGAFLWGATALVAARAGRSACTSCGRASDWSCEHDVALRRRALRTGQIAVMIAVAAALVYPAIRLPWAFGIGFGLDAATWAELQAAPGAVATGLGLAAAGAAGATLMLGLVQDWGLRFPRWMVGLAGRRVPPLLAIAPASIVAVSLIASGRGWLVTLIAGRMPPAIMDEAWVQLVAMLSFLPWGLALAVATGAYARRRRGTCTTCTRGLPEPIQTLGGGHRPE